ncbi:sugar ABC transporter permease [Buchananella hordeovulneris]|uniref:sugar ABC transporter permease n=1 Tax=Buchananella hordeovulneris TaxID=52770 RepID=UPI000A05BF9F|nr:ABC transporter permease subunit [Buchananella hordeovulneris]
MNSTSSPAPEVFDETVEVHEPAWDAALPEPTVWRWLRTVGWKHFLALIIIAIASFPLLYVLSTALNPNPTLAGSNQLFSDFTGDNFVALNKTYYWKWVTNSLVVSTATAIGTVFMAACAAYALSRFRFRGRRPTLTFLLLVQMFPQMLAFVAIFLLLHSLAEVFPVLGTDSLIALICVYLGGALGSNTFLMYGFFNTIPRELDEAAMIDGASHSRIFFTIILRMVTPMLAVVGLLSFVSSLGEFIIAKLVLQSESQWTLAVGMYVWGSDQRTAPWGMFAAGAVVAAVPVILLFMYLQRYIVSGLTAGAVKG